MKIEFKNVGLLKHAEIDLSKDLIVLAGPNNTGKTYAAYSVYGLYKFNRENRFKLRLDTNIPESGDWVITLKEKGQYSLNILNLFRKLKSNIEQRNCDTLKSELGNIFDTEDSFFEKSSIALLIDEEVAIENLRMIPVNNNLVFGKTNIKIVKEENNENVEIFLIEKNDSEIFFETNKLFSPDNFITSILEEMVLSIISRTIFNNVFIAPAERSAINIFSRQLSIKRNLMVDKLLEYKDKRKSEDILSKAQRYPLPIRDSLEIAEDVVELQKNKSDYAFLADKIEEDLLKGKVKISKEGSVQFNPSGSKVKNLEIHLTASIVKSLSNLVFYFRHLAKKGDFIIIDEPELNLHPDNQRKIARLIGEFVNHGFKVMISTHSDYIIREINNLIMLKIGGEKADNLVIKYGYESIQLIDHKRVGAYLFHKNKNVSIDVTETGFEIDTINEEINNLNNAAEEIYFTLFD